MKLLMLDARHSPYIRATYAMVEVRQSISGGACHMPDAQFDCVIRLRDALRDFAEAVNAKAMEREQIACLRDAYLAVDDLVRLYAMGELRPVMECIQDIGQRMGFWAVMP